MPFLSTKTTRASTRLILVVSIWVIFTSGNAGAFSLASWMPSEGSFALGQWQGGLVAGYEWEDQQLTSGGTTTSEVRNRFDEDLHLRNNDFYIVDPRLIDASAGCDIDFFQESDKFSGSSNSQDGTLIGWDAVATFLEEMPYTATVFSHRYQGDLSTDFGGQTSILNQSFGGMFNLRQDSFLRESLPYFHADVYARQEDVDQSTTQFGQTYTDDETRDVAGLDAYKGFLTGDLDFNYQFVNDRYTGSISNSYTTNWAGLTYSLDFGPALNRRLDSQITYLSRDGDGESEQFLYADNRVRIDHFTNLSTTYEDLFVYTDSQGQWDASNMASFEIQHHLYQNLVNSLTLQGFYEMLSQGHRDFGAVEHNTGYNRSIPWGGNIFFGGDERYQIEQDHVNGPITVLDEKHTAPPFFGPGLGFTLGSPFVVTSTIVMYDTRGGARIPTVLGVDYVLVPQGQLTEIVILPTTLKILPGDPLEVSYSYVVGPTGRYSTTSLSADGGVTFGWIGFFLSHQQTSQSMQSGQGAQYLYSMHEETGQLNLQRDWEWVYARAVATYEIYHTRSQSTGSFDYTLQDYGEFFTFRPGWSTILNLDGNEMFTDYTDSGQTSSFLDFEASLDRFLSSGNFFTTFASARQVSQSDFPTETDYEVGMRANFRYGKIYVWPWFSWIYRKYGSTESNDPHLMIKIGRDL